MCFTLFSKCTFAGVSRAVAPTAEFGESRGSECRRGGDLPSGGRFVYISSPVSYFLVPGANDKTHKLRIFAASWRAQSRPMAVKTDDTFIGVWRRLHAVFVLFDFLGVTRAMLRCDSIFFSKGPPMLEFCRSRRPLMLPICC